MGVRWVKRECVGPMGKSSHASLNWKREEAFEKSQFKFQRSRRKRKSISFQKVVNSASKDLGLIGFNIFRKYQLTKYLPRLIGRATNALVPP